jgi:hypothetical protein
MLLDDSPPSAEVLAARQVRQAIRSAILEAVAAVKQTHTQIWMMEGLDPQNEFDEFGTNGGAYIAAQDALVAMITAVAEANGQTVDDYIDAMWYQPAPGKTVTVNMDGTVTVGDV